MDNSARRPRGKTQFPGIVADSARLGVSRNFLFKVLRNEATSKPLLARYQKLKSEQRRVA
jgi:hypothetical protein